MKVSVVIPAKDAELYIGDSVGCLSYQGLPNQEIEPIIIDDGSLDDTQTVARGALESFPHGQIIHNDVPSGVSKARNTGIHAAQGQYIAFLDADDWFATGHLGRMVQAMDKLSVDFVRTDVVRATRKTRKLWSAPLAVRGVPLHTYDHILAHGWQQTMVDFPNTLAGLYRRDLAADGTLLFDESLRTAEDREWNWRLFLAGLKFSVIDSRGPVYRQSVPTSLTATYNESQMDIVWSCLTTIRQCRSRAETDRFAIKAGHNLLALVDIHLKRREMTPELRRELSDRTIAALEELRAEEVEAIVESFAEARRNRLAAVLSGDKGTSR